MISVGKIAGNFVADVTGNEDLGQLVGIGVDVYMGNYLGAAEQARGLDLGGENAFTTDSYDYHAGGFEEVDGDYTAREYLADQRVTNEMLDDAKRTDDWSTVVDNEYTDEQYQSDLVDDARQTDDWSAVVDNEMSQPEFEMLDEDGNVIQSDDALADELNEIFEDTEALLDEQDELDAGIANVDEFETDEEAANDAVRDAQRA